MISNTVHRSVLQFGMEKVAKAIGKCAGTLSKELNPKEKNHKLGADDLQKIIKVTGCPMAVNHLAEILGQVFSYEADHLSHLKDGDVFDNYAAMMAMQGGLSLDFNEALHDNKIDRKEVVQLRSSAHKSIAAILEFLKRLDKNIAEKGSFYVK